MTKKCFLFLSIFILYFISLNSQEPVEINIPSVTVEGKGKLEKKDTYHFDDDLSGSWETDKEYKFEADLEDFGFERILDNPRQANKSVEIFLGYKNFLNLRGNYKSKTNKLLNFALKNNLFFCDSSWYKFSNSIFWSPTISQSLANFGFSSLKTKIKGLQTNVTKGQYRQTFEIEQEFLKSIDGFFSFELFDQKIDSSDTKEADINFLVASTIQYQDFFIEPKVFYFAQKINADINIHQVVDYYGIFGIGGWLGLTENSVFPSFSFAGLFYLPNDAYFSIENTPFVSEISRYFLMDENYLQKVDFKLKQSLSPINITFKLGYKDYFKLYNNTKYSIDCSYYVRDSKSIYTVNYGDFLLNRSGAEFNLEYGDFTFFDNVYWEVASGNELNYLPFAAAFANDFSVDYVYKKVFYSSFSFLINLAIKDENKKSLSDRFILNFQEKWQKTQNLAFILNINNLLSQKNSIYSGYPEGNFSALLGINYSF